MTMMEPAVVDLTASSSETDEVNYLAVKSAPKLYDPGRVNAIGLTRGELYDEVDESPERAARVALQSFLPRKQKSLVKKEDVEENYAELRIKQGLHERNANEKGRTQIVEFAVHRNLSQQTRTDRLSSDSTFSVASKDAQTACDDFLPPTVQAQVEKPIEKGSLAAFLQDEPSANPPTPTSLTPPHGHPRPVALGQPQSHRHGSHGHPAPRSASESSGSRSSASRPNTTAFHSHSMNAVVRVEDLQDQSSPAGPMNARPAVLSASRSPYGDNRPRKRRRTDETEDSNSSSDAARSNLLQKNPSSTAVGNFSKQTKSLAVGRAPSKPAKPTHSPNLKRELRIAQLQNRLMTRRIKFDVQALHRPVNNENGLKTGFRDERQALLAQPAGQSQLSPSSTSAESDTSSEHEEEQTVNNGSGLSPRVDHDKSSLITTSNDARSADVRAGPLPPTALPSIAAQSVHGTQYTPEDDALLIKLKEIDQLSWRDIYTHFPSRSYGSIQVRYSGLKKKATKLSKPVARRQNLPAPKQIGALASAQLGPSHPSRLARKRRGNEESVLAGFVSWKDVQDGLVNTKQSRDESPKDAYVNAEVKFDGERAHMKSMQQILRQRELGIGSIRDRFASKLCIPDDLKERVFSGIGPSRYWKGTSGDVTAVAWAPDGNNFAAGSIAISDERSMQYNRPYNLLLGDCERGELQELPEHHIPRPKVKLDRSNVNALSSMQQTQEPRLFMTVSSVQFSPSGSTMYSAGSDFKVRAYSTGPARGSCLYELDHPAPLDLLSVHGFHEGLLATGCHRSTDGSVGVYQGEEQLLSLSPSRVGQQTDRAIFPSALRWGLAWNHAQYLLAGFSIDSIDAERDIAGETCLWDVKTGTPVKILGVTRNVFDVAWNPSPSSGSTTFAVASARGSSETGKGTRSIVQCFAPGLKGLSRVIEWECPAFDINDVLYCQHDDNLIAAGATDGKVYIWDQRFATRSQAPLHVLEHGDTLNILDHDREREVADTGVRFLAWGATSSRLYSGSSDGVIKVWNPYQSTANAHIHDVATFTSAVMSGAFSPDYRDLLIGEDQGRINLLSVGHEYRAVRSMHHFELKTAPVAEIKENRLAPAQELLDTHQMIVTPMGDLPKLQAVQGPKYNGPYFEPSEEELALTKCHVEDAVKDTERARAALLAVGDGDNEQEQQLLHKARARVQQARDQLDALQNRLKSASELHERAGENQLALRTRAKHRLTLEETPCALDCNYLPANCEDDGFVLDSRRSESRIPGALSRLAPFLDVSNMAPEDAREAGLTHKCISCLGPAPQPSAAKRTALCERCSIVRNGLTSACEQCSAPIRPPSENSESKLCEKCNFGCFRCGKPALFSHDGRLTCERCALVWQAGVLGFELMLSTKRTQWMSRADVTPWGVKQKAAAVRSDLEGEDDELGAEEMEHYASLWK